MVSLIDIVPQKRVVQIAAGELELHGLGLRQIADLFLQFPMLRNAFTEGAPEVDLVDVATQAPGAVGVIIAEAAGQPEAAEAITGGSALTPDEAMECLLAIRDLTFPRGIDPLMVRLAALLRGGTVAGPSGRAPDTTSLPAPNGSLPADTITAP
jgi:hypothetical protein